MTIPHISVHEARARIESGNSILVDVREPDEFAQVHIEGAVNVPVSAFDVAAVLNEAGARHIIFLCRSGRRAENIWKRYTEETGHDATCMTGSITAWIDEGLPVVTGG